MSNPAESANVIVVGGGSAGAVLAARLSQDPARTVLLLEAGHAYALDDLQLDGVLLFSNARGVYLGDLRFTQLFDELQRRAAVVLVHPNTSPDPSAHCARPGVTRCCACCATSWESTAPSSVPTSLTCAGT